MCYFCESTDVASFHFAKHSCPFRSLITSMGKQWNNFVGLENLNRIRTSAACSMRETRPMVDWKVDYTLSSHAAWVLSKVIKYCGTTKSCGYDIADAVLFAGAPDIKCEIELTFHIGNIVWAIVIVLFIDEVEKWKIHNLWLILIMTMCI